MSDTQALDILKQAILLEKRGEAFYLKVADQAKNAAVRDFFRMMADEEHRHVEILTGHAKSLSENQEFKPDALDDAAGRTATIVLNDKVTNRIGAAGFEAAAISAAMLMEERAITLYAGRAESAGSPEEKALYHWLASWERDHLKALSEIDKALTESVWYDNNFWPF